MFLQGGTGCYLLADLGCVDFDMDVLMSSYYLLKNLARLPGQDGMVYQLKQSKRCHGHVLQQVLQPDKVLINLGRKIIAA